MIHWCDRVIYWKPHQCIKWFLLEILVAMWQGNVNYSQIMASSTNSFRSLFFKVLHGILVSTLFVYRQINVKGGLEHGWATSEAGGRLTPVCLRLWFCSVLQPRWQNHAAQQWSLYTLVTKHVLRLHPSRFKHWRRETRVSPVKKNLKV